MKRRLIVTAGAASLGGLVFSASAQTQARSFNGPVKIIVGFAPGGGTDMVARVPLTSTSVAAQAATLILAAKRGFGARRAKPASQCLAPRGEGAQDITGVAIHPQGRASGAAPSAALAQRLQH